MLFQFDTVSSQDVLPYRTSPSLLPSDPAASESSTKHVEKDANENRSLKSFLLFGNLPAEIRLKIWHIILHDQRTITIERFRNLIPRNPVDRGNNMERIQRTFVVARDSCPAVLLAVCSESRAEALNFYGGGKIPGNTIIGWSREERGEKKDFVRGGGKTVFVNFARTTFSLVTRDLSNLCGPLLNQIQHLRLLVTDAPYFVHFAMDGLRLMTSLRTLTLDVKKGEVFSWSVKPKQWYRALVNDFEREKLTNDSSAWKFPRVIFFDAETGEKVAEIEEGEADPERIFEDIAHGADAADWIVG